MTNRTLIRILCALFLAAPGITHACTLDVDATSTSAWSGASGRGYDVFDPAIYYQPLSFNVRSLDEACNFFVTAAPSEGEQSVLRGSNGSLAYAVYRDATGAQEFKSSSLATQADIISGVADVKGKSNFQIAYAVPAQQVVQPGVYSGEITLDVYEGDVTMGVLRKQVQVPISVTVPSTAEISFSQGVFDPSFGIYTLNFHTLHQGDIKGVTLRARGNGGFRVVVRSLHGGVMRPLDPSETSTVAYGVTVNGVPADIGRGDLTLAQEVDATPASGKNYRFDFTVGDIRDASAGDYYDILSVILISLK